MTHPQGEEPECVLRTLNICEQHCELASGFVPTTCARKFKCIIEEEKWQDQHRPTRVSPGEHYHVLDDSSHPGYLAECIVLGCTYRVAAYAEDEL